LKSAKNPMGVRVVTESDIYALWSVIAMKSTCDNFSVCLLARLAYLIYKAARHWRRGRKAGSTEPAFSASKTFTQVDLF
jgi:hypothetical protein